MLLPAENAYDRELVFEEAEFAARRYGAAGLKIGSTEMHVACAHELRGAPCACCGAPVKAVSYLVGLRRLCTRCAKDAVS